MTVIYVLAGFILEFISTNLLFNLAEFELINSVFVSRYYLWTGVAYCIFAILGTMIYNKSKLLICLICFAYIYSFMCLFMMFDVGFYKLSGFVYDDIINYTLMYRILEFTALLHAARNYFVNLTVNSLWLKSHRYTCELR